MVRNDDFRRYAYWSDRRIRQIATDNGVSLAPRWRFATTMKVVPFLPEIRIDQEARTLRRATIADRIERLIGERAVEDFATPPSAQFAKGVGLITFSQFAGVRETKNAAVMCVKAFSSIGKRVVVCLFGSLENMADYVGGSDSPDDGWSSSAACAIEIFIRSHGTINKSQWDDPEAISIEAWNIARNQGITREDDYHRNRPWTRGFTLAHANESEWFAEIYSDVELDKSRWSFYDEEEDVDRILIGAPLWIRTPSSGSVVRYGSDRRWLEQTDPIHEVE